jgi:hypothetical protein
MQDEFMGLVQKRLDTIPPEKYARHIVQLLPLIEQEQAKEHPFLFAKHLVMRWWRMTHG